MKAPSLTIGIEEEYQIIDPVTRELRSYITEILKEDSVVLGEVKPESVQLTGNNRAALDRMSKRLVAWNKDGRHDEVLARLNGALKDKCAMPSAVDAAWCESLFVPSKRA